MFPEDDFFDATPQLQAIRQWAHARYAAKWAVFLAVLLRVSASTSPGVQLPGVIGGAASLNLIGAFVSRSGGGKGTSDKVAKLAWPRPIIERPIGSGEGIAALFAPPRKEGAERISQAIINVSEIDSLTGIASRQGSILLAQLKAAVMGELIGQSNASEATTRVVLPHTYRMCMSIGAQPGHCDVIFNDATGGTPQRLLWMPTIDPGMPADPPPDPPPLDVALPAWSRSDTEITYGPDEIREQIITAHLARQRGDSDALDGHRMLTRCKVAAVLAIMHHRSVVSDLDWELSETVMAVSDNTRTWLVSEATQAARAKIRDRAMSRVTGEEFIDQRRMEVVKRRVLRVLEDGRTSRRILQARLGKKEYRELLDSALAELSTGGLIQSPEERIYERVEFIAEPEFSTHNRSSEALNRQFSAELGGTVTSLDSRRSTSEESCEQWLARYTTELRAQGHTTVSSDEAFLAGERSGYHRGVVASARAKVGLTVISRGGTGPSVWSLTPDAEPYVPASEWVHSYLNQLPAGTETVDRDHFRAAAEAADYSWPRARAALTTSGRIETVPPPSGSKSRRDGIWRIRVEEAS